MSIVDIFVVFSVGGIIDEVINSVSSNLGSGDNESFLVTVCFFSYLLCVLFYLNGTNMQPNTLEYYSDL